MRVGFTGTRHGMTASQLSMVKTVLQDLLVSDVENWFHHGVCVGADEEAAEFARWLGYKLHGHPPINTSKMSSIVSDVLSEPKDYLVRNRDIVDACRVLVTAPFGQLEDVRSGTWSTWRYAGRVNRLRIMVLSDGTARGAHRF